LTKWRPGFFPNADPAGVAQVFIGGMQGSLFNGFIAMDEELIDTIFPVDHNAMMKLIARTAAHEIGHLLGLVDTMLSGDNRHNSKPLTRGEMMNRGDFGRLQWILTDTPVWRPINASYLQFLLPKE